AIGTAVANRTRPEVEDLIGFFVNTLVLRTAVRGERTVRALLAHVRDVCLGAYAHQELPFEQLVEALNPERHLSRTPLLQVMLMLQNVTMPSLSFPNLRLEQVEGDTRVVRFDLELLIGEEAQQLVGVLGYATDLFEARTAARLAGHWMRVLEEMAT